MALSDLAIRNLTPKPTRYEIHDGHGLYLRIMPTGAKTWVLRYTFDGKARRFTLGKYPGTSLSKAHEKAAQAKIEIQQGFDPARKEKAEQEARTQAPDLETMLAEFWEKELSLSPSGQERRRLVEKDALPTLGSRKVAEISRRDVVLLIDKVRDRAPAVANRLQGVLVRLFNFAAERGVIEFSPLTGLRKKAEHARQRVLSDTEIKMLWEATDPSTMTMDAFVGTKAALRLILLLGQRPGEVAGMTWAEIDGDTWAIPAGRRKTRNDHVVPLSSLAVEILDAMRPVSGGSQFVFRSSQGAEDRPMERLSLSRAVARHWQEIGFNEAWTPHDLRRTVRTRLAELGIDDVTAEQVLGHKIAGIAGVYNRHGYDLEKRQALERWARKLRQIVGIEEVERGRVIPFRRVVG